jgi:hypothetical protein
MLRLNGFGFGLSRLMVRRCLVLEAQFRNLRVGSVVKFPGSDVELEVVRVFDWWDGDAVRVLLSDGSDVDLVKDRKLVEGLQLVNHAC